LRKRVGDDISMMGAIKARLKHESGKNHRIVKENERRLRGRGILRRAREFGGNADESRGQ
jgi:hypothetical protein